MNLTDDEENVLRDLIDRFRVLYENLRKAEEKLDLLDKTRKLLRDQIEKLEEDINETRRIESEVTQELVEKYGMFDINLETFEITPTQENEQ
jgi:cell division protein FtsB